MFLCCFPSSRGSGLKKTRSEGCFSCCRNWRRRHRRQPSSSGTRQPQLPEGSPGQAHPGQVPTGVPPRQPHTSYPSSWVCMVVGGGAGERGMRGARPGQEQVVRCRKPGGSVMFMAQVTAGRKGRRVLGPSPSAHLLIGVKVSSPSLPAWRSLQKPLCARSEGQNL